MTIQFCSLRGTTLQGRVQETKKMKGLQVYFVHMLNRIYAVTDNYSIDEAEQGTDQKEFEKSILLQL